MKPRWEKIGWGWYGQYMLCRRLTDKRSKYCIWYDGEGWCISQSPGDYSEQLRGPFPTLEVAKATFLLLDLS